MSALRDEHLFAPGPKRILALDGGGVRGLIALAFLERIETILRERTGRPELRISDHFDLIGGSSTGAVISTGLALGHSVTHMIDLYLHLARQGFQPHHWLGGILVPKFRADALMQALRTQLGEETLGSEKLVTGLALMAKRLDTGGIWVFHNNPKGPYFAPEGVHARATPNRDLQLAHLVRAATAAPSYFEPELIEIAHGISGAFVDGGISPHNNPAMLLLMVATLKRYGYAWPMGPDRLTLVSVGTGCPPVELPAENLMEMPAGWLAVNALRSLMHECAWYNQALLQWVSQSPTRWPINEEMGDLSDETPNDSPLVHYVRYDAILDQPWLRRHLDLDFDPEEMKALAASDRFDYVEKLLAIGRRAAELQVQPEHIRF